MILSLGCCGVCWTYGEGVGQGEDGEWADQAALVAEGDEIDDDREQSVATTDAVSTYQPAISAIGGGCIRSTI